jgi:DnaJ-class molecular chaperone
MGPVEPAQPDHYFNLGLTEPATSADIKKAFHRLALLHHPDKKAPGTTSDAAEFHKVSSLETFNKTKRLIHDCRCEQRSMC